MGFAPGFDWTSRFWPSTSLGRSKLGTSTLLQSLGGFGIFFINVFLISK